MATEGLTKQSCGECGSDQYKLYRNKAHALIIECQGCGSQVIVAAVATYRLDWLPGCVGEPCSKY